MKSKTILLIFIILITSLSFISAATDSESTINSGDFNWLLLAMSLVLILFIMVAIYVSLIVIYKKKYETYLFKNKNNFYNLINYVSNSKSGGWSNKDIISRLKKSGWKAEQINYVMEEYAGKSRNLAEIPIDKILNKSEGKSLSQGKQMPEKNK